MIENQSSLIETQIVIYRADKTHLLGWEMGTTLYPGSLAPSTVLLISIVPAAVCWPSNNDPRPQNPLSFDIEHSMRKAGGK